MKNISNIIVAIDCITYNHESYIRDCLEGFIMQKTNFKFVAIVHDDASIDGTAKIIKEYADKYPDIIKPIFEIENQYSKRDGSIQRIMSDAINATGAKYVAMCEGDDYWIDPYKLQKQVDFMEKHPECGFIGTKCKIRRKNEIVDEDIVYLNNPIEIKGIYEYYDNVFEKYAMYGPPIRTVSLLYRTELLYNENPIGDYTLQAILAYKSNLAFINEECCVYRVHDTGVSNAKDDKSKLAYTQWYIEQKLFLNNRFPTECHFDQDELNDILLYLKLRIAIRDNRYKDAKIYKSQIKTYKYKKKYMYKRFNGFMSFLFLSIVSKLKINRI